MRIIAFLIDYAVVDRIINHLKLTFVAERPPPPHIVSQEFLRDPERPRLNISYDFLLELKESSMQFLALFQLSA